MPRRGTLLLVLCLVVVLLFVWGRRAFPPREGPPVFYASQPVGVVVALGEGFARRGIHHYSDGTTPLVVISMTDPALKAMNVGAGSWQRPLLSGERLQLSVAADGVTVQLVRSFLPASQRMLLGIPLHPEQMSRSDWEALPGVGPKLAEAIESDRQKNGDFGSLEGLSRVRGVGSGKIESWRQYFSVGGSQWLR